MSKYKPATINDNDVIHRRYEDLKRQIFEANIPSGSQAQATSSRVSGDTQDLTEIENRLSAVEIKAQDALEDAASAEAMAEAAQLPIDSTVFMTKKTKPSLVGTWAYLGAVNEETTDGEIITLHLYNRTA